MKWGFVFLALFSAALACRGPHSVVNIGGQMVPAAGMLLLRRQLMTRLDRVLSEFEAEMNVDKRIEACNKDEKCVYDIVSGAYSAIESRIKSMPVSLNTLQRVQREYSRRADCKEWVEQNPDETAACVDYVLASMGGKPTSPGNCTVPLDFATSAVLFISESAQKEHDEKTEKALQAVERFEDAMNLMNDALKKVGDEEH